MRTLAIREQKTNASQLAVSKRFGRYKKETEKPTRKADVKIDPALEKIKHAWKRLSGIYNLHELDDKDDRHWDPKNQYEVALGFIENIDYTASTVAKFCISMFDFVKSGTWATDGGIFLAALINNSSDNSDYLVTLDSDRCPFWWIGLRNNKNVIIQGENAGHNVGAHMVSGKLLIEGNVDEGVGIGMSGGIITVNGSAKKGVGHRMSGGTVVINGDVMLKAKSRYIDFEENIGDHMAGGEIHINGEILSPFDSAELLESIENKVEKGKIFWKGRLIVDK